MKVCSKCKIEKPKTEFSKCSRANDGLLTKCAACYAEYHAANREKNNARSAEYHAANKEKIRARSAEYRAANKEKIRARSAEYYAANPDKFVARNAAWVAANPDRKAATNRNRRAIKRNADGKHTAADIRTIFDKQQGLCANCQTKLFKSGSKKYHIDHIMPLSLGGSNWPSNLQCLCPSCNLSKGAKHPTDWAKQQGRLL